MARGYAAERAADRVGILPIPRTQQRYIQRRSSGSLGRPTIARSAAQHDGCPSHTEAGSSGAYFDVTAFP
jgi:hypothetical protein